jgi:hypothetical protein
MRNLLVFERRFLLDVLYKAAEARTENDSSMGRRRPHFFDEGRGGLNFVEETVHGTNLPRSEI